MLCSERTASGYRKSSQTWKDLKDQAIKSKVIKGEMGGGEDKRILEIPKKLREFLLEVTRSAHM
jgi:hypothetical protein